MEESRQLARSYLFIVISTLEKYQRPYCHHHHLLLMVEGQVLLVHCHQHFVKVCSPKHNRPRRLARSTLSTFVILEMFIHRRVIILLVVVVININSCLTLL